MKILLLNGSPNKNGQTIKLADMLTGKLDGEIKTVHTYDVSVAACTDCKGCFKRPGCAVEDDMQEIYDLIDWAELFLFASPLHFGTFSGKLMTVASRFQTYWAADYVRKDRAKPKNRRGSVNILTAGAKWNNMFLLAEGVSAFLLGAVQAEPLGSLYAAGTDRLAADENPEAVKQAEVIAASIKAFLCD